MTQLLTEEEKNKVFENVLAECTKKMMEAFYKEMDEFHIGNSGKIKDIDSIILISKIITASGTMMFLSLKHYLAKYKINYNELADIIPRGLKKSMKKVLNESVSVS